MTDRMAGPLVLAAALSVPAIGSCRGAAPPALSAPTLAAARPAGDGAAPPPPGAASFEPTLREAKALLSGGETALAIERIEAALRAGAPAAVRPELLGLLKEARARDVRERWLDVEIVSERGTYAIGDVVPLSIRVRSRRDGEITIPIDASGAGDAVPSGVGLSRTRVDVRFSCREIDHFGTTVDVAWEGGFEPDSELVIPPRGSVSLPVSVATGDPIFRPGRVVYRRLRVEGTLRPVAIVAPGEAAFAALEFGPLVLDVWPLGYHRYLGDPRAGLEEALRAAALDNRFLPHVLVAAVFLGRADPEACDAVLAAAAAEAGPELARTVAECREMLREGEFEVRPPPPPPSPQPLPSSSRARVPDQDPEARSRSAGRDRSSREVTESR